MIYFNLVRIFVGQGFKKPESWEHAKIRLEKWNFLVGELANTEMLR